MTLAKRFKSPEAFSHSGKGEYHLLPSRFVELNNGNYLLTNLVGEFVALTREDLEHFVRHRLLHGDLYTELQAKHMLADEDSNVAVDLLALKVRTRAQKRSNFTSLHIMVVSLRCDMTCQYCQVSRQTENRAAYDMDQATAERALEFIFNSPSPAIKIEFQGGEPLLNFSLIQYVVERAESINREMQRDLAFVITSNLSLLTDEILDYCLQHDIVLSTSLDGPETLHNKNRPRPGRNSYELTIAGIKKAQAMLGREKVSALMTTTEASLPLAREIIDTYIGLGLNSIFFRSISPYGFAIKTGHALLYDMEKWLDFWKEGLEYIIELNRRGVFFVEQYTAILLEKIYSPFGTGFVDLDSPAGAGTMALVYNYDGAIYASDESRMLAEMGDKTFRIGSLHENTYEEALLNETLLDTLERTMPEGCPQCTDCGFLPYCGADPLYHHATQGDAVGHKALSEFCRRQTGALRHIFHLLIERPETRQILMSWVKLR